MGQQITYSSRLATLLVFGGTVFTTYAQMNNNRIWDHVVSGSHLVSGEQVMLAFNGSQVPVASVLPSPLDHQLLTVSDPITGNFLFSVGVDSLRDRFWNAIPCTPEWSALELDGAGVFRGVIPHPGNPDLYYLITQTSDTSSSYVWSLFDRTLNNGVGGLTAQRNMPWITGVMGGFHGLLSALDGGIYWFVTHEPNSDVWRFDPILPASGIGDPPVLIPFGPVFDQATSNSGWLRIAGHNQRLMYGYKEGVDWKVDICAVDPNALTFGQRLTLPIWTPFSSSPIPTISPDGTKLYRAGYGLDSTFVEQFDLEAGAPTDVVSSLTRQLLAPNTDLGVGLHHILPMPDGKMHVDLTCSDPCLTTDHMPFVAFPEALGSASGLSVPGFYTGGTFNGSFTPPMLWWPVHSGIGENVSEIGNSARATLIVNRVDDASVRVTLEGEVHAKGARLRVLDALGKLVIDNTWPSGAQQTFVNTTSFTSGVYLFELRNTDGSLATTKWVRD